jgi:DsbC/DsbD-like thiol-disulfide interchange protein
MDIAKGWHINAHQPLQETLIATEISLKNDNYWHLESVSYPEPALKTLRFEKKPLALYHGQVQIQARLKPKSEQNHVPLQLNLQLQTCNQESCLPPETISLLVF